MSQTFKGAFRPIHGATVTRSVSTTSANVAIPASALGATAVRVVFTAGTAGARVRSGVGSGTTAVAGDMMVNNPGTPFAYAESFGINASDTYMAAITDAGTCTVEFTFGFGA
jgi:hypothetical protein